MIRNGALIGAGRAIVEQRGSALKKNLCPNRFSAFENEKFAQRVIDHQGCKNVRTEGVCCEHPEAPDQKHHNGAADRERDARNKVKKSNFRNPRMAAWNENPVNID
jgi:hypothetical protein